MARTKTPLLLQLEAVECGAACLGMILEYHGRYVPLTELRTQCGVSRDGVKASNMIKAAHKFGLKGKGLRETLPSAMRLRTPYIAFWNFNHFVVVEGFDAKRRIAYINDPAHGHRKVSLAEFDTSFTGVVLVLEPASGFQKGGTKPGLIKSLRARLQHAKSTILFLFLTGLVLTVPGLILPAFTGLFLDQVLGEMRLDWLRPLLLALLVTLLFRLALQAVKYTILRRLEVHLSITMSSGFLWHLLKLPVAFYSQRYSGEIATRQQLNDRLAHTLAGRLADTCLSVLMMGFYAALMLYYSVQLTAVAVAFAAITFFALRRLSRSRADSNIRLRQEFGRVAGATIAALHSMETIKSSGRESAFFTTWAGRYAKAINTVQELQVASQALTTLPYVLNGLTTVLTYLLGGLAVTDGQMSVGTLIAFTALVAQFQAPISGLVDLAGTMQELQGDLNRLDDVLGAAPDPEAVGQHPEEPAEPGEWPLQLSGHVTLHEITFGYSPLDPPLFEGITIDVPPGKRVALVGSSGSGKTTLAHLVCGLYRPWSGSVLFDGRPRAEVPRSVLTNSFAVVSQEIFLFEGTVRDNLTLWDKTIPDEALLRACADAAILDVVLALPGGLDGWVLEGGANLSGGQRQRLEIARALVRNPTILVLDEATSALDSETEAVIAERLCRRGCTCVLVAHRLSTIRDCDEIVVLQRGKIAQRGTHEELWQSQNLYAEMLRAGESVEEKAV